MTFQDLFDLMKTWKNNDARWEVKIEDDKGDILSAVRKDGSLVFEEDTVYSNDWDEDELEDDEDEDWEDDD